MRRVVVVVLDGLRRDLIDEAHMPALDRFARRSQVFAAHRSMFPSAPTILAHLGLPAEGMDGRRLQGA